MHAFILLCLAAAATAEHLGYNYEVPARQNVATGGAFNGANGVGIGIGVGNRGGSEATGITYNSANGVGIGIGVGNRGGSEATGITYNSANGVGTGIGIGNSGGSAGSGSYGYNSNNNNNINNNNGIGSGTNSGFGGFTSSNDANNIAADNALTYSTPTSLEYNKEFYTYNAPEEEFQDNSESVRIINSLKKNLRVVFIKAPENQALTNAALQLAKQATEDRTAIYVLNKQADVGELAHKLQQIKSTSANKPEVHFVKYRTPEDAVHAQQAIQAQYDAIGGPSHRSNEAVAPVLNFASAGSPFQAPTASSSSGGSNLKNTYLPPSLTKL